MNSNTQTLEFLSKNYHPFVHFSEETLTKAASSLRVFRITAGESLSIQAYSSEDTLYVTSGSANISLSNEPSIAEYHANDKRAFHFSNRQSPITITTDVSATICHADSALLNDFVFLEKIAKAPQVKDKEIFMQRLMFLKTTQVFRFLPLGVVEKASHCCEEVQVSKDQEVIKQDMKGDSFYIILEGRAEVWREELEDDEPQMVSLLREGDAFGEEALIIGGGQSATVKMTTDGRLLKLSEKDFEKLISATALRSVTAEVAKERIDEGAEILDVRFAEEYEESSLPNSMLIPLPELRSQLHRFDKNKDYMVLCAAGMRAAVATMILRQKGVNAKFIEGGIKHWPFPIDKALDLELILFDFCPYAQRGVISLLQNDIPCKLTYLDPDNLPDWFAEVSPFGNVPILRVDGKTNIFESSVINELIALLSTVEMLPSDPIELSVSRSWTEFGSTLLGQVTGILSVKSEEEFIEKRSAFHANLSRLEEQLKGRGPFFSGRNFSLIDSTYAPLFMRMNHLNKRVPLYDVRDFPRIGVWSKNLLSLDSVKNSTPKKFEDIYNWFIQRRGAGGWLGKKFIEGNNKS